MKKLIAQVLKFGIVGVLAFLVDYGVLYVLTEFAHVYYLLSAGISFAISVVVNYLCSMRFVFVRREDMGRAREFTLFVLLSVAGLILNECLMWLGVDHFYLHYMLVKIFATAVVMVWNFISRKLWLEKRGEQPK